MAMEKELKTMKNMERAAVILVILVVATLTYTQVMVNKVAAMASSGEFAQQAGSAGNEAASSQTSVIPTGMPRLYGEELGVSYDDISPYDQRKADEAIKRLAYLDNYIELAPEELERYIKIGMQISCEYCCGAEAIIFRNGQAACGCAHSFAMRGVAKFLLREHPNDFTDDEILEELGKWKTLFFPGQMQGKAAALEQNGIEFNYINLASNRYRGIEQGLSAGGGMVGGC